MKWRSIIPILSIVLAFADAASLRRGMIPGLDSLPHLAADGLHLIGGEFHHFGQILPLPLDGFPDLSQLAQSGSFAVDDGVNAVENVLTDENAPAAEPENVVQGADSSASEDNAVEDSMPTVGADAQDVDQDGDKRPTNSQAALAKLHAQGLHNDEIKLLMRDDSSVALLLEMCSMQDLYPQNKGLHRMCLNTPEDVDAQDYQSVEVDLDPKYKSLDFSDTNAVADAALDILESTDVSDLDAVERELVIAGVMEKLIALDTHHRLYKAMKSENINHENHLQFEMEQLSLLIMQRYIERQQVGLNQPSPTSTPKPAVENTFLQELGFSEEEIQFNEIDKAIAVELCFKKDDFPEADFGTLCDELTRDVDIEAIDVNIDPKYASTNFSNPKAVADAAAEIIEELHIVESTELSLSQKMEEVAGVLEGLLALDRHRKFYRAIKSGNVDHEPHFEYEMEVLSMMVMNQYI